MSRSHRGGGSLGIITLYFIVTNANSVKVMTMGTGEGGKISNKCEHQTVPHKNDLKLRVKLSFIFLIPWTPQVLYTPERV